MIRFAKKARRITICVLLFVFFLFSAGGISSAYAFTSATVGNSSYVNTVSELLVSDYTTRVDGKAFNSGSLSTLYQYLTGSSTATYSNVASLVSGTQTYGTATIPKIVTATALNTTNGGKDTVVTFGGLKWTVASLTKDTAGNVICTLWLATSSQLTTATSQWGAFSNTTTYGSYPSNMYGTSYMRVVTLNAGGNYATSVSSLSSYSQSSTNQFAKFTMANVTGSVTSYIITPAFIKYQEIEAATTSSPVNNPDYNRKNESWGTPVTGTWTTTNDNYTSKTNYSAWKNDYLWIPCMTETGGFTSNTTYAGIWNVTLNQMADSNSVWLRGGTAGGSYIINSFESTTSMAPTNNIPTTALGIRPALHLNLTAAERDSANGVQTEFDQPTASGAGTVTYSGAANRLILNGYYADYMTYTTSGATATVSGTTLTLSATNAGTYSITVSLKSADHSWADGGGSDALTYTLTVAQATPTVVPLFGAVCTSDTLPTIALDTGQSTNGTIKWADGATFDNAVWEFTPSDTTNYSTLTSKTTLNATGHNYTVSWQWATDYSTATASYVCANCGDSGTETVDTKKTVTKIATCSEEGETKYTATLVLDGITVGTDERTVSSPMIDHDYGDPVWTWSADHSTATATLTCTRDASHVISGNASVQSSITTFPTCDDEGVMTHVATVTLNGTKYTDTQTAPISALGHDWGEPVWNWTGVKLAVATFTCETDPSHTTQQAATITQSSSTATCTVAGTTVYTATVELDGITYTDEKTVAGSTVPHDYVLTWTWTIADDYSTASATVYYECANCGDYGTLVATVTRKERPATCEVDGEISFTATVNLQDTDDTDTKTKSIPAVGHNYVKGQWQWTGNLSASLSFTCENCGDVQTVSAKSTYRDTVAATADSEGERVYTVTVTFEGFDYTDSKTVKTPKLSETTDGAVTVTTVDGSSLTIDYQAVATSTVTAIPLQAGYTGVNAYDVVFSDGSVSLSDGSEVTVTMLITLAYRETSGLKVYYIAADGTATEIEATKSGDNMTFRTDKLGRFVIACATSAVVPDTPSTGDGGSSSDGSTGSSSGGLPEGFPLWQVIAGGVSIVLAVVFVAAACRYGSRAKQFKKKRERLAYAPAGIMNGGMLFGIADSVWTTVAIALVCLCVASFVFMLVNKSRMNKAEAAYETANAEAQREERRRRDDEMRMMFMSMGGQRGKVMDDNGNFTEIRSDTDVEAIVTRVVAALLPTIQSNQLPAGNSEELNALKAQQSKLLEEQNRLLKEQGEMLNELKELRGERRAPSPAASGDSRPQQGQTTVEKILVKENSEEVIRKLAEHDRQLKEILEREDDGFNDIMDDGTL